MKDAKQAKGICMLCSSEWPTSLHDTELRLIKVFSLFSSFLLSLLKWKNVENRKRVRGNEFIQKFSPVAKYVEIEIRLKFVNDEKIWNKCRHRLHFSCNLSKTNQDERRSWPSALQAENRRMLSFDKVVLKSFKPILWRKFVKIISVGHFKQPKYWPE